MRGVPERVLDPEPSDELVEARRAHEHVLRIGAVLKQGRVDPLLPPGRGEGHAMRASRCSHSAAASASRSASAFVMIAL